MYERNSNLRNTKMFKFLPKLRQFQAIPNEAKLLKHTPSCMRQ